MITVKLLCSMGKGRKRGRERDIEGDRERERQGEEEEGEGRGREEKRRLKVGRQKADTSYHSGTPWPLIQWQEYTEELYKKDLHD